MKSNKTMSNTVLNMIRVIKELKKSRCSSYLGPLLAQQGE